MEMTQVMRTGAGRYMQGTDILEKVGGELRRLGHRKICILHGHKAYAAAGKRLEAGLLLAGITWSARPYDGFCTASDVDAVAAWVALEQTDCLLGVGGGKVLDAAKAAAVLAKVPVFTAPTCAATCAAFAPLSVLYDENGRQQSIRYHEDSVDGVFVDLGVLAEAPPRYLAAGIADAFAKSCEYASMHDHLNYGDIDFGRFIGYKLARESDAVLLRCARKAVADNQAKRTSSDLNDAVTCLIAIIGVVSGFAAYAARGNARFAIAHGFNEIIRGQYVPDTKRWLHGELVGVGILAQLHANGASQDDIDAIRTLFTDLNLPTSLQALGMVYGEAGVDGFIDHLLRHTKMDPAHHQRVRASVYAVM